jgi:translation initiation factor 3 subunit I
MRPIVLHGHTRPLTELRYNREGDLLFSAARDNVVTVWYSDNGERLGTYEGHNGVVYGLDVDDTTRRLVTASADEQVWVWDVETGRKLHVLPHNSVVRSVSLSSGGEFLLSASEARRGGVCTVSCWSMKELEETGSCSEPVFQTQYPNAQKINRVRWGPLNEVFYTASDDMTVRQFDGVNGDPLNMDKGYTSKVMDINMSLDGTMFISACDDHTAKVYDAYNMDVLTVVKTDRQLKSAILSPIREHIICGGGQDASKVTTSSSKSGKFEILFHHMVYGNLLGDIKGHYGPVNTLAFCPDGKSFSSGGEEGTIRINHFDDDYFEFKMA